MAQTILSNALCTLQDLKDYLGVTSSTYDTRMIMAINLGTRLILDYTDRTFASTSYTEDTHGTGTRTLQLLHYPVIGTPTQVNIDANRSFATSGDLTINTDYVLDSEHGHLHLLQAPVGFTSGIWPRGQQNIRVKYTAGYATIPDSIKMSCIDLSSFLFKSQGSRGHVQQSVGGLFIGESTTSIPKQFREQLDPWRRQHEIFEQFDDFGDF